MRPGHNPSPQHWGGSLPLLGRPAGLGIGQVFALIFGFLITSALIFLFGIWVGRDVTERRLAQEERIVRVPIPVRPTPKEQAAAPQAAQPQAGEGEVDLAFFQRLKDKAIQRLQETAAPSVPTAAPSAAPPQAAAPQAVGRAPQATTPTRPIQPMAEKPTPVPRAKAPEEHRETERRGTERRDEWADAGWTVQVNATTNPQQATDLAHGLRAKGYDAYTVQAPMRGQTWYRVRVGRFSSREKAKELEAKLKNTEGLENAYVAPL